MAGNHSCNGKEVFFHTGCLGQRAEQSLVGHKHESFQLAGQKVMCYLLPKKRLYQDGLDAGNV